MINYFQTTILHKRIKPQNKSISFNSQEFNRYSLMCIPVSKQGYTTENQDFFSVFYIFNYNFITFYLNKESYQNVYG